MTTTQADIILRIIDATATTYGVTRLGILHGRRTARLAWPRHVAMYLSCQAGFSIRFVASVFRRCPNTICHAVSVVSNRLATEPANAERILEVQHQLQIA